MSWKRGFAKSVLHACDRKFLIRIGRVVGEGIFQHRWQHHCSRMTHEAAQLWNGCWESLGCGLLISLSAVLQSFEYVIFLRYIVDRKHDVLSNSTESEGQ